MSETTHTSSGIAATLRERIALAAPEADPLFAEGQLAQEFGVSRTPIRQALQHLSYERLVTIRSGVGSVVVPLDAANHDTDVSVACSILEAAADCAEQEDLPFHLGAQFSGYLGMLTMVDQIDRAVYFNVRAQMLQTLADLIRSEVLKDAFRASYWRLVRWRIADFTADPAHQAELLKQQLMAIVESTKTGKASRVLQSAARAELAMSKLEAA